MSFDIDVKSYLTNLKELPLADKVVKNYEKGNISLIEALQELQRIDIEVMKLGNKIYKHNYQLDINSEYIIESGREVSVMIDGLEPVIRDTAEEIGISSIDDVDVYVFLNPILRDVTFIEVVLKLSDDSEKEIFVKYILDSKNMYKNILLQDKDGKLKDTLSEAVKEVA